MQHVGKCTLFDDHIHVTLQCHIIKQYASFIFTYLQSKSLLVSFLVSPLRLVSLLVLLLYGILALNYFQPFR